MSVFETIMEAPSLDHGDGGYLPPSPGDGDGRHDPDYLLLFIIGFGIGYCGVAFVDYVRKAIAEMRR